MLAPRSLPRSRRPTRSLWGLLAADYARLYGGRSETGATQLRKVLVRFLTNPSLHAVVMIRSALAGPPVLMGMWRHALLAKHSIDLEPGCVLGPGLILPHPFGILLGAGVEVGTNVILYHNVTLGGLGQGGRAAPVIGDGVIVYTGAMILAGAVVAPRASIGAYSIVDGEVPEGGVFVRGRVRLRSEEH